MPGSTRLATSTVSACAGGLGRGLALPLVPGSAGDGALVAGAGSATVRPASSEPP